MQEVKLQEAYLEDEVFAAICDHFAARAKNQKETKLRRLQVLLRREGVPASRAKLVESFKTLQESDCGVFVKGSRGWPSRFEWSASSRWVGAIASGDSFPPGELDDFFDEADESGSIQHTFQLRAELSVDFELPADLTPHEASRLAKFIQALPIEEA